MSGFFLSVFGASLCPYMPHVRFVLWNDVSLCGQAAVHAPSCHLVAVNPKLLGTFQNCCLSVWARVLCLSGDYLGVESLDDR